MPENPATADPRKPRRRWFRFRLRTRLIGVALLGATFSRLDSRFRMGRERKSLLVRVHALGGYYETPTDAVRYEPNLDSYGSPIHSSVTRKIRELLGDFQIERILLPDNIPESDAQEIRGAFPAAIFWQWPHDRR